MKRVATPAAGARFRGARRSPGRGAVQRVVPAAGRGLSRLYASTSRTATPMPSQSCPVHRGTLKQRAARAVEGLFRSLGGKIAGIFNGIDRATQFTTMADLVDALSRRRAELASALFVQVRPTMTIPVQDSTGPRSREASAARQSSRRSCARRLRGASGRRGIPGRRPHAFPACGRPRRGRVDVVIRRRPHARARRRGQRLLQRPGRGAGRAAATSSSSTRRSALSRSGVAISARRAARLRRKSIDPRRVSPGPITRGAASRSRARSIYEMHVGTFTREGTWAAAARELHGAGARSASR